jgi:CHAT domain
LAEEDIESIVRTFIDFKETEQSKIFDTPAFGYWKVVVERPLRIKGIDSGLAYTPKEIKAFKAEHGVDASAPPVIRKIHKSGKADPLRGLFEALIKGKRWVVEYEPDTDLRDTEQVPLREPGGIEAFINAKCCRMRLMPGSTRMPPRSGTRSASIDTSTSRSHCGRSMRSTRHFGGRTTNGRLAERNRRKLDMIDGLKPYSAYKDSDVPWLGDVPEHWEVGRLKRYAANVIEQTGEREAGDIYVALEHVESWTGYLRDDELGVTFDSQVKRFRAGDVMFGKLRPYLAKVTRPCKHGVCVSEFFVLRPLRALFPAAITLDPTFVAVREFLVGCNSIDALHVACHGAASGEATQIAGLYLSENPDDIIDNSGVRQALRLAADSNPIVFLNACQVGRAGAGINKIDGFAQAFLAPRSNSGAAAVVAPLWSVGDLKARTFANVFYQQLLKGVTLVDAVREARAQAKGQSELTWLSYCVYGDPFARVVATS